MTPQLQQAIKLLQLSSLELQTEIQQVLDSNPMLEVTEPGDDNDDPADYDDRKGGDSEITSEAGERASDTDRSELDFGDADFRDLNSRDADSRDPDFRDSEFRDSELRDSEYSERSLDRDSSAGSSEAEREFDDNRNTERDDYGADEHTPDTSESLQQASLDTDLPVDAQWEDWDFSPPAGGNRPDGEEDFDYQGETRESLHDHLRWQLNLTPFSDTDRAIAEAIIDAIDDDGYLRTSCQELHDSLDEDGSLDLEEVQAVIHRIQQFDPAGVAARDLGECLLIQLRQLGQDEPRRVHAALIVRDYLPLLGARDFKTLLRKTKLSEDELRSAIATIQQLNPRPGSAMTRSAAEYITPDVIVSKKRNRWTVELNPDIAPRLRINASYASLIQRTRTAADNSFLRNHLQEAKWFIKSLQSRNETLLKVATAIVEQQIGFFEHGAEAMKPMVLANIAELLGMHESTISRVTTQKYMHTSRGIFELKYFFSSHVATTAGGEASSTAIRARIRKLIDAETANKPLSDSQIAEILAKEGIVVARRTVAKYREAMAIPPSSERKALV